MQPSVTIELPLPTYRQLQAAAQRQKRAIPEMVQQLLTQTPTALPPLPVALAEELSAFTRLSTEVLWLLARTTLAIEQRTMLEVLNRKAQQVDGLTVTEQEQQAALLALYQSTLVRRATAANLLKQRGADISSRFTLLLG
ncbi:MAG: hypothetical protein R3E79_12305 [Caldilineaceae bacterium]